MVESLKAQVAALTELLSVQEAAVGEQSAKLGQTIQELTNAKEAIEASEGRLRTLVATISDWIWEMDRNGVYTYASPKVRDLLGYGPEEMVGKRFFDFMPQEEATILAAVHEELVASGMPIGPREATLIHRDGHPVSIEVSGVPFFAPGGSLLGFRGVDRDITERKRAEEVLRASQERYRVVSEGSPQGILIADSETRQFVYANPWMCRLLGHTEKELLQLGVADIHPKDSLGRVASEFESQARGEKTLAPELPCLRKDGTVFYADVAARPIILDGGQQCLVGFFADVTERRQAEHQLAQRMKELQALYSLGEMAEREGITLDTLYRACTNILPKGWQYPEIACARIVIGDSEFRTENFAVSPWKQSAPVKVNGSVVGRIEVGYLEQKPEEDEGPFLKEESLLIDAIAKRMGHITERKQAEEALRASEVHHRTLLEAVPQRIFCKDRDSVYLYCNGNYARDLGIAAHEIVGRTDYDFYSEELASKYRSDDQRTMKSGQAEELDEQYTRDGRVLIVHTAKTPLKDREGNVVGVLGVFWDITERKQAEERLRRYAADLRRANEEVKQFAYIVSHDLRAPLISLRGFSGELRSSCATMKSHLAQILPLLNEEQQREVSAVVHQEVPEALGFIDASVERMDSFINAVLALSRLGRRELSFERVELREVVQDALKALAHQIEERRVEVTVGSLPEVVADRTAMEQILGNILTNAVNYLEPGRAGQIEVGGERRDGETSLFVRDNGRGIAEADMPKVFAPFRRAGRQDVKGEGMGLAYAQALAQRHGGHIRCESELGVGTTFTLVLSNHPDQEGNDDDMGPADVHASGHDSGGRG